MSRLLFALAVAALLLLVGAFVPVKGLTLVERWTGAPVATSPSGPTAPSGAAQRAGPGSRPEQKALPRPVENHSDADRLAIDRIVSEHSGDPVPPRKR